MTDDRVPPHDQDAEQAVLGSLMLSAQAVLDVAEIITQDDFYLPKHQLIYAAAMTIQQAGEPVDAVTLADELGKTGNLRGTGGAPYLHSLIQAVPLASSAAHYAQIVADKATLRRLTQAAIHIDQLARTDYDDVGELVEQARATVDKLAVPDRAGDTAELGDLITTALAEYESPVEPGEPTGWADVDEALGGLRPGTLTVIGARPGIGKSVLALRIAAHIAARGRGAVMFSLEMSRGELMTRFFAAEANVELANLRDHALSTEDWRRIHRAAERARDWPLAVNDSPRIGLTGITARARDRTRTPRGLSLIVVDYLQLIAPADSRAPRQEQIAGISRGLKLLARELRVPVVAAAQVNRGSEHRADRKPTLADLRESGAIEADADNVLLLHDDGTPGELEVIIAKNRQGPKKSVRLAWVPYYATARSMSRLDYEESA